MSLLSTIGGLVPAAYQGFTKGVDDETARQQREADATYQKEQRDRARAIAPVEDEARVSRLKASIDADKTAGIKGGIERTLLEEQQKNLPQQLTDARIAQELQSAKTAADATTSLLAMGGQAAAYGDTAGLNRVFGHMINAGLVAKPDGSKLEPPVNTSIVQAPSGSVDFAGQPIEGRAIQATMPDGTRHYVSTKFMDDAYKRQVQAADAASVKMIKPGERAFVPRTGQVIAEGQPRITSQGYYDSETGEFVPTRPGASGAAGSRLGAGGRAPEDASKQAQDALEFLTKSDEFKSLTTSQVASAQLFTERAVAAGVTPREAALIGVEVAKDPTKAKTYIDASGDVKSAYSDPNINGGRPIVLAAGVSSLGEVAKTPEGLKSVTAAVTGILDSQVRATEARTPEQQKAVRDQFIKAAHNPADRAALLKAISGAGPEAVAAMDKKLELLRLYGPRQEAEKPTAGSPDGTQKKGVFEFGGLGGGEKYTPPADSRAGRAQARQAELRAQNEAKAQKDAAAKEDLSKQFNADLKALAPIDLSRKYDSMRWSMKAEDAAALQQVEKNIR